MHREGISKEAVISGYSRPVNARRQLFLSSSRPLESQKDKIVSCTENSERYNISQKDCGDWNNEVKEVQFRYYREGSLLYRVTPEIIRRRRRRGSIRYAFNQVRIGDNIKLNKYYEGRERLSVYRILDNSDRAIAQNSSLDNETAVIICEVSLIFYRAENNETRRLNSIRHSLFNRYSPRSYYRSLLLPLLLQLLDDLERRGISSVYAQVRSRDPQRRSAEYQPGSSKSRGLMVNINARYVTERATRYG